MIKTTRRRLIEYMQTKRMVSAAELARVMKLTAADIRHHLASLVDDGVVSVIETRVHGRGRPTQWYGLTSEMNRHNMALLANALLSEWLIGLTEENQGNAFDKIAAHLLEGYNLLDGNLTQRLTRAVRQLNDMNYQARWEAHSTGPRILITHCPYIPVIAEHPEICRVDELFMARLLAQPVSHISELNKNRRHEVLCVFRLVIQ